MKLRHAGLICVLAMSASGCAHPQLDFQVVSGPDKDGLVKYQLPESVISFSKGKTSSGVETDQIIISSVPVPDSEKTYALKGTSLYRNWLAETNIGVTFRSDTTLIQEIDVTVTDHGVQAIQALGTAAVAAGGLMSLNLTKGQSADAAPVLPSGLPMTPLIESPPSQCAGHSNEQIVCKDLPLPGTKDYVADLTISAEPVDAFPAATLDASFSAKVFYYSACRPTTITLKPTSSDQGNPSVTASVIVADPRYLQTLRLPAKGKVVVGASCGASSTSEAAGLPTAFDYINALMTQAKAVNDAAKKTSSTAATKTAPKT